MATVREILNKKGAHVHTIDQSASVLQAAFLMNKHQIGALVVLDGEQAVGIFSERDLLQRVVVAQRDVTTTPVAEVMTTEMFCCTLETSIEEGAGR